MASSALKLLAETYARNERSKRPEYVTRKESQRDTASKQRDTKDAANSKAFDIGHTVTPVTPQNRHDRLAEADAGWFEAVERAAVEAADRTPKRLRKRMAAWAQPKDAPTRGDYCGCCSGQLWWIETGRPQQWRCCQCHPPRALGPGSFRAVAT